MRLNRLAAIAAAASGMALMAAAPPQTIEEEEAERQRLKRAAEREASKKERMARPIASWRGQHKPKGSIATENRNGGAHQHSREIERRKRQEARRSVNS